MASLAARLYPPSFLPERDMPDVSGKIAVVTGGNISMGYHTVKQLLLKNANVYLAARSPEKAAAAIKSLAEETRKTAIFTELDLGDLRSMRRGAGAFLAQESKLDLLFNNGIWHERLWPLLFTELLLPALTQSHRDTNVRARVINTSSIRSDTCLRRGVELTFRRLYKESKLGNIFISNYLSRTHADVLASCALHPGGINTELSRHRSSFMQAAGNLWGPTMVPPEEINGQYLVPWDKIGKNARVGDSQLENEVMKGESQFCGDGLL
ncbi:hypothetical protein B0H19DRAFT_1068212 [Mycena capillaripes]|nr:hypothetical protein B0H19DRAFT_1068212 [Mycena capillaripes]